MATPLTRPYGSWKSPITSDLIVAESISLVDVLVDGSNLYWIEGRPQEGGRHVLVRCDADGTLQDRTPPSFNARTRVHEYGGGAVTVANGVIYFSNFKDQRLYRLDLNTRATPQAITAENFRYADGRIAREHSVWIGVREDHSDSSREPLNTIVAVFPDGSQPERVLVEGNDFYASPRVSPDGKKLAWITWNHPEMPWTNSTLWVADLDKTVGVINPQRVAGGTNESVFQPEWSPSGELFFISDRSGWWNLHRLAAGQVEALYPREAEFGRAQWVFGLSTYAFVSETRLLCSIQERGLGYLGWLHLDTKEWTLLELPYTDYSHLRVYQHAPGQPLSAVFLAGSAHQPTSVVRLNTETGSWEVLRRASTATDNTELARCLTTPQSVEFPTENGLTAHGLYYPPCNPDYTAPQGERPPLVVHSHGGPTGAARSTLRWGIQYYTSRGIAVLDVNYGGSTGYGRAYRDRLNGQWGVVDVDDCVNGARFLAQQGKVDEERVVITGGSAGGWTKLAALTFRDFFKGGASHFGVSDAAALAQDTHKFESRYLDGLIGPYPEQKERYQERSAVCHAEQVKVPVIFFQGDEDEIVPVNQTERMVEALRSRNIPVGYLLFSGEQHGFRKAENIKRALDAELYFFAHLIFRVGLFY